MGFAVLGTSAPRTLIALGYRTTGMLLATVAALLLVAGSIVVFMLWRLQHRRAERRASEGRPADDTVLHRIAGAS